MARCEGRGGNPTRARKLHGCPRKATAEVDGRGLCTSCAREELRDEEEPMVPLTGERLLDRGLELIRGAPEGGRAMAFLLKANDSEQLDAEQKSKGFTTALRYLKRAAGLAPNSNAALTTWDGITGRSKEELVELYRSALVILRLEQTL